MASLISEYQKDDNKLFFNFLCKIIMQGKFTHIKAFGQHFLKSEQTAVKIVNALPFNLSDTILEIGPGGGILSKQLLKLPSKIYFSEIDWRIINFLKKELHIAGENILEGDFLKYPLTDKFKDSFLIIGNFPYNISSQILFKVLENRNLIPALVGMFQREMAQRITASQGNKTYGVISVFIQANYTTEYLFELKPDEFEPSPKVHSAVIRLIRKSETKDYDEILFKQIVKTAFNQRRKKLSNAMSSIPQAKIALNQIGFAEKRAEQLSVTDFILLTKKVAALKTDLKNA